MAMAMAVATEDWAPKMKLRITHIYVVLTLPSVTPQTRSQLGKTRAKRIGYQETTKGSWIEVRRENKRAYKLAREGGTGRCPDLSTQPSETWCRAPDSRL